MNLSIDIETGAELKFENIASFRKKIKNTEVQQEIAAFMNELQQAGAVKNGPVITTTFSLEQTGSETLFDLEFLVPLKTPVPLSEGRKLKPLFHLVNALYTRYTGNPGDIEKVYGIINDYLVRHQLQQITTGYNVTVDEGNPALGVWPTIEIYLGINPNRL